MNDFKYKKLPSAIALAISSTLFFTACDNTPSTFTMGDIQTDSEEKNDGKDKPSKPSVPCEVLQNMKDGKCVAITITNIQPLAVVADQLATFSIVGENFPTDIKIKIPKCEGEVTAQSDTRIEYQCTPKAGKYQLLLTRGDDVFLSQEIMVTEGKKYPTEQLPPAPSSPQSTIEGVDSNNNGVRDEVERELAEYVTDEESYKKSLISAKAYQKVLTQPSPTSREQALAIMTGIDCETLDGININVNNKGVYIPLTFDNDARQDKYRKLVHALEGGYLGSELGECQ